MRRKRIGAQRFGRNASGRTAEATGKFESIDGDRIFTLDVDPWRREIRETCGTITPIDPRLAPTRIPGGP